MKKVYAVMLSFILVLGLVLASAFVMAESGSNNSDDDFDDNEENESSKNKSRDDSDDQDDDDEDEKNNNRSNDDDENDDDEDENEVEVEHEFYDQNGTKVKIKTKTKLEDGKSVTEYKISVKGIDANSKFEIKEVTKGNKTTFELESKGNLSQIINYLPDDVAEIAKNALELQNLNLSELNITLQDSKHKNIPKVVYNVQTNEHGKFLGVFKIKAKVETEVDPETGEVILVSKPWWAFLIVGDKSISNGGNNSTGNNTNNTNTNNTTTNNSTINNTNINQTNNNSTNNSSN